MSACASPGRPPDSSCCQQYAAPADRQGWSTPSWYSRPTSPAVGLKARLAGPRGPVRGAREGLDDREDQRHGAARAGLLGGARQEVARPGHHVVVDGARRGEHLECGLDVNRQAGRAARVRLEGMAEPAVVVLIAAQASTTLPAGWPRKQVANSRRSSSRAWSSKKRSAAANASSIARRYGGRLPGCLEQNGHPPGKTKPLSSQSANASRSPRSAPHREPRCWATVAMQNERCSQRQKSATAQGQMIAGKQRRTAGNNRAV